MPVSSSTISTAAHVLPLSPIAESMVLERTHDLSFRMLPNGIIRLSDDATESDRIRALGVDLSQYPSIDKREIFESLETQTNRELILPIFKSFMYKALKLHGQPTMLTHIVTTRCNYSCHFCSFADTLNVKTNELSLEEIEKTYSTIGDSLNTIVYSGGETTINKQLPDIIEAAYRLTPVKSVYIISNAWKPELIFQLTHRIMQRCPGLHLTWSLSIEGPKPINNETRYTKSKNWDAWQNTVDTAEGLKRMRELYGYDELDVQMCTVCSPSNQQLMHDWYEMVRDVLRPDKWNLNLMRRSVQMSDDQLVSFEERRKQKTLEAFESTYVAITERLRQDVLSGRMQFCYHTDNALDGAMKSAVDLLSQEANRRVVLEDTMPGKIPFCCQAGNFGAFIGSEGEVGGCEEFTMNPTDNKSFGNLRDSDFDFQAVWTSPKAEIERQKVGSAKECKGCTLESQKNYPAILVSFRSLFQAFKLARKIPVTRV